MKKILLSVAVICLFSCTERTVSSKDIVYTGIVLEDGAHQIKIVTIDGCQYLVNGPLYEGGIAHKGNCNNYSEHNCVKKQ